MTGSVQDKLLPAADTARLFGRTLRTLANWERAGLLLPVRIRRQRYYRLQDIQALLSNPDETGSLESVSGQEDSL